MYIDGVWTDITTDVRQTHAVKIVKGGGEVSEAPRPSTLSLVLNDQNGKYRPDRATSPLYGKVGRNTPIAVPGGIFEISGWKPDRTVDYNGRGRGDQICEIDAGGVLRRIGTWTDPVTSALTQTILDKYGSVLLGYWPLEDKPSATYPNPVVGALVDTQYGQLSRFNFNNAFGNTDTPAGANSSAEIGAYTSLSGYCNPGSVTSGWSVGWAFKLRATPQDANYNRIIVIDHPDVQFSVWINDTNYRVILVDENSAGSITPVDTPYADSPGPPTFWTYMVLEVAHTSATTSAWTLRWYQQNDDTIYSAGTTSALQSASPAIIAAGNFVPQSSIDGMLISQIVAVTGTAQDLLDADMVQAFNGFPGETAADRFGRLMDASGVDWTLEGDPAASAPMGPQGPLTLLEHLKEIRDTEDGVLYDDPDALAVTLRTRDDLYGQTPALALTYGVNVAAPFLPVIDDLDTSNVVTTTQRSGGSATVRDDTGPMGTLPPPDGAGEYKQSIDVNMASDSDLQPRAYWALKIGTNPEARYNSVVVDLDANPELTTACEAVKPGDRITVTGADPDLTDLMVVNITDQYDTQFRRTFTFACRPYRAYNTGIYDDTTKRYDSATSSLNAGYSATATTMVVKFTDINDAWSQVSAPYDWDVMGERIRVNSMGAITGSGPWTQSAGVTRSINGVVKSHLTGESVHIHQDQLARYAL